MTMPMLTPPILQLHPTRACNLRCLHCYSSSGPGEQHPQDAQLLVRAIGDAATLGYRVVSISGGEPLLYAELPSLLLEARRQGMQATLTTNGLLLDNRHLPLLKENVVFLAISVDGKPERHNRMRNARRAFEAMSRRLELLRSSGMAFGFIFTLTHDNLEDLSWVAEFAVEQGAQLLQVHPLEEVGRAQSELKGQKPTDIDATIAWLLIDCLRRKFAGRLKLHLDFIDRDLLRELSFQRRLEGMAGGHDLDRIQLADLISPLVVETDGTVVPLQHGFPRNYALGSLGSASLLEMAQTWLRSGRPTWEALCESTKDSLCEADLPLVNWYESLACFARDVKSTPFPILQAV